jgi:hypothetical protein
MNTETKHTGGEVPHATIYETAMQLVHGSLWPNDVKKPNVFEVAELITKQLKPLLDELRIGRTAISQSDSLIAAIDGNREGMSHSDLVLTCNMLERGRAQWRKEAEDMAAELATLRADKAELLEALKGCVPALEDAGLVAGPLVKARALIAKHSKATT